MTFASLYCLQGTEAFKFAFRDLAQLISDLSEQNKLWAIEIFFRCVRETVSKLKNQLMEDKTGEKAHKTRIFFGMYSREVILSLLSSFLSSSALYELKDNNMFQHTKNYAWIAFSKVAKA